MTGPEQDRDFADDQPCDELPHYSLTSDDVDAFAREWDHA